jgi:hypothetical protein
MIYQINDLINAQTIYFVIDVETQAQGQALELLNSIWNIGTEQDANNYLLQIQQTYLDQCKDRFSACHTSINENGYEVWKACDLTKEQPNNNEIYQIFNVINGSYTKTIGLENAKLQIEKTKQNFLNFAGMKSIITLDTFPKKPKKKTQGTQTL